MEELRAYLLGVVAVAIVCGILTKLTDPKSTVGVTVRLAAGFLLLLSVVRPWSELPVENLLDWTDAISADGAAYVALGEMEAEESYRAGIIERTQTYILDEARALHCDLQVEVTLTAEQLPVPKTVRLSGDVSPYARQAINTMLTEQLGIEREDIIWT